MKVLQLISLGEKAVEGLKDSFNNLPHTDHKDGKYRLRRYSRVEIRTTFWDAKEEAELSLLEKQDFTQSEDYNKHQGGMSRSFKDIENEVLENEGMKEICLSFMKEHNLMSGQELEIHQMRVLCQEDGVAKVAPEGVHQDGYDCIGMIGVDRCDIHGGELLAYETRDPFAWAAPDKPSPKSSPFLHYTLQSGDMVLLDDHYFWHNATSITSTKSDKSGYGDWFVICANR